MDFNDTYKATFGTFYPSKFQISSVLLGCLFLNSTSKMRELLSMEAKDSHLKNSEIYFSLRSGLPDLREEDLKFWLGQLSKFQIQENQDETQKRLQLRLKLNYLINCIKMLEDNPKHRALLPANDQHMILQYVR